MKIKDLNKEGACAYPDMQKSKKSCYECRLTKDMCSIMKKLDLI